MKFTSVKTATFGGYKFDKINDEYFVVNGDGMSDCQLSFGCTIAQPNFIYNGKKGLLWINEHQYVIDGCIQTPPKYVGSPQVSDIVDSMFSFG